MDSVIKQRVLSKLKKKVILQESSLYKDYDKINNSVNRSDPKFDNLLNHSIDLSKLF
jgi:hypothetical protein